MLLGETPIQAKVRLEWGTVGYPLPSAKPKQVPFGELRAGSPLRRCFAARCNCSGRDDRFLVNGLLRMPLRFECGFSAVRSEEQIPR